MSLEDLDDARPDADRPLLAGAIRRAGRKRVGAYLKKRGVARAEALAENALEAAKSQSTKLLAEHVASEIAAELARSVLALKQRIDELDEDLRRRFLARPAN